MNNNLNSGWLSDDKPSIKQIDKFTGKGWEIFRDPSRKERGEIHSNDGRLSIQALMGGNNKISPISISKQAVELCLRRQEKAKPMTQDEIKRREIWQHTGLYSPEREKEAEEQDRLNAHQYGMNFSRAILEGELHKFARAIVKEFETQKEKSEAKKNQRMRMEGYFNAVTAVCFRATHPNEITIQAVKEKIECDRRAYSRYGFNAATFTVKDIRKGLKTIGFGWLQAGTRSGRRQKNGVY